MKKIRLLTLPLMIGLVSAMAVAQVPPNIAEQNRAIGRKVDTIATSNIYSPLQPKPPYPGVTVERELKFGEHAKQVLDVFTPATGGELARPVLIMVHGGGFVRGDKNIDETGNPSAFYDNVMLWAVKNGMVGVNINYRLAPEFQYPAVQQDIGAAVRWVQENIGRYGGDAGNIALMGHSAGAAHVASYIARPEYGPGGETGVARAIFSSGSYDFTPEGSTPHSYFGASAAGSSSIAGLVSTDIPYLVILAEYDPVPFHVQAGMLMNAVCSAGSCPPFVLAKDHGHMSGVYSINTSDTSMSGPILNFLKQQEGPEE
jgi:triacylglycerol lipase